MQITVGRATWDGEPDVVLFPEPGSVIANWSEDLAARVVPVLAYDRSLIDVSKHGLVAVVVWDDPAFSYLDAKQAEDGRLVLPDLTSLRPLDDPFDRAASRRRFGTGLRLERLTLPLDAPTEMPDWDYQTRFAEVLREVSGAAAQCCFDIYPRYVQDPGYVSEAYRIACELDCELVGVGAGVFYVYVASDGVSVEMQMS